MKYSEVLIGVADVSNYLNAFPDFRRLWSPYHFFRIPTHVLLCNHPSSDELHKLTWLSWSSSLFQTQNDSRGRWENLFNTWCRGSTGYMIISTLVLSGKVGMILYIPFFFPKQKKRKTSRNIQKYKIMKTLFFFPPGLNFEPLHSGIESLPRALC